jgi:putative DNA primase/helicase
VSAREPLPREIAERLGLKTQKHTAGHNLTDLGNAERLVELHGEDFRYCHQWGRALTWDGKRFAPDTTGVVERMAKNTVRSIYVEAANAEDTDRRKALSRHATGSEARNKIQAMQALAWSEPGVPVEPDALDRDAWLLNCENGTLDLRSGELRPHRREDLMTKLAPVVYDPDAQAPTWEVFLERVLPSEGLRRFVRRVVGYALTGDTSEQILPFLYGPGANGKSTLVNTVLEMMGDYGKQAAPDLLVVKQGAHPTELADLFGARFVPSIEVEDGRRFAESLVKQLTGQDKIKARFMRQDFWEFSPTHKVVLVANHKPTVRGTDHAIWRRIKMVPFDVIIPKEEQDPQLPDKLREELPGILAWAVRGSLERQREGLGEPEEVKSATEGYRIEMDVLAAFIEDRCVVNARAEAGATPLYKSYEAWCSEMGEQTETQTRFGKRLAERGFESARHPKTRLKMWRGIGLLDPRDPDDPESESVTVEENVTVRNDHKGLNRAHSSHIATNTKTVTDCYEDKNRYEEDPDYDELVKNRMQHLEEEGI